MFHKLHTISAILFECIRLFAKLPTLIKAYLKFNASIGTGAVIDNKFKTTDVFIFLPIEKINKEYVNKILE